MHTLGPWNVDDGRGRGGPEDRIAIEAGGNPQTNGIVTAVVNRMLPEAMANAKLIAAAPDLLAALEDILILAQMGLEDHRLRRIEGGRNHDLTYVIENGERWVGLCQEEYDRLTKARDAIAKAKS
jgi:hypothetical protein